ncbi:MAG: MarR family transcriptional regulator [Pseudomonadota bacterium]
MASKQMQRKGKTDAQVVTEDAGLVFAILSEVHIVHQMSTGDFNKAQNNELHMSHFSLLNRLVRNGDAQTPQRLAQQMNQTRATMTNSLARLSDRGYIDVIENPRDRRSKLVFLTPAGRKARDTAIGRIAPTMQRYIEGMSSEDLADLYRLLRKMHGAMDVNDEENPQF